VGPGGICGLGSGSGMQVGGAAGAGVGDMLGACPGSGAFSESKMTAFSSGLGALPFAFIEGDFSSTGLDGLSIGIDRVCRVAV